mgnify:CR=1 FL=1
MTNSGLSKYGWESNKSKDSHNYIFPKIQELIPQKNTLESWMLAVAMDIWLLN